MAEAPSLAALLEPGVVAVETYDTGGPSPAMPPEESACVAAAVAKRRREFAFGRACSRAALAGLGRGRPAPVVSGEHGAPLWPPGVVGSITHVEGYYAAAVAAVSDFAAVGIDAAANRPLPPAVARIAAGEELQGLPGGERWPTVVFSAKEAVFKAWFPLTGRRLGFEDARVTLDPVAGTFVARLRRDGASAASLVEGRFEVTPRLVLTAVCLAACRLT